MTEKNSYTVGGNVHSGSLYIFRPADEELLALCRAGTFAYVLSSRQIGKSSLMDRTAVRLSDEGIYSVRIDLSLIGTQDITAEQWYLGLLERISLELHLEDDVEKWWLTHAHLGTTDRLTRFFEEVLLVQVTNQVVIFIDEIDTTLDLDFTDDFFVAIRAFYNARTRSPVFQRLSFVLIGVATPTDLIHNTERTPFNIGQRVDIDDFTFQEALPLTNGLGLPDDLGRQALIWILEWTQGHPYLTQHLCSIIAQQGRRAISKAEIDILVSETFFNEMSEKDSNLVFIQKMLLTKRHDLADVLLTYREIYSGERPIYDEAQSIIKSHLKLAGVVRRKNNLLVIRNPIYERVFNRHWVQEHLPAELTKSIYTVGGSVQANRGDYIHRKADAELLALCRNKAFAYILSSRQIGKTSLIVNTAEKLAGEGTHSIIIDLTLLGVQISAEQWYIGLLSLIIERLQFDINVEQWWHERAQLGVTDRLTRFFQEILLQHVTGHTVIFLDEIDTTLSLDFTDDFFAAIRALYDARSHNSDLVRLSFVLIGVANPSDLMRNVSRTPFNIGQRVEVTDFTFDEVLPLADGLGLPHDLGTNVLKWVLEWTGGHPYLTQRMCRVIAEQEWSNASKADVDSLVSSTFFGIRSERDSNLQSVRTMLLRPPAELRLYVLPTYREIRRAQQPVLDEAQSLVKSHLKLSGVVRSENDVLQVRNRIYKTVFDDRWVKEHLPDIWTRRLLGIVTAAAVILAVGLLVAIIYNQDQDKKASVAQYNIAVTDRDQAHNGRATAEALQQQAKTAQAVAEIQRDQATATVVAAITTQVAAESSRTIAETAQANAVTAQQAAELSRTIAETAQANAVTAQQAAESERDQATAAVAVAVTAQVVAELSRTIAETAQVSAVSAQQTAESQRNQATATVAAAVETQQAAETARAVAESQRDQANTTRDTAVVIATAGRQTAVAGQQGTATALMAPTIAAQDQATAIASTAYITATALAGQPQSISSGNIIFQSTKTNVITAEGQFHNFNTTIEFTNPSLTGQLSSSSKENWSYGFIFRFTDWNKPHYRLFADSNAQWHFQLVSTINNIGQFSELASGKLEILATDIGKINSLRIIAKDKVAWFYVNNFYITTLDISEPIDQGYILVGIGLQTGYGVENQTIRYDNFKVSRL